MSPIFSDQYADKERQSNFVYPHGFKLKPLSEQVGGVCQLFPGLGYAADEMVEPKLPSGAEGLYAIPRWEKVAATYNEAVAKVLELIAVSRKFYNYRANELGEQYLRRHARTTTLFQLLGEKQKGSDILIVPCQFGLRHRGYSVGRAREVFVANEVGLGAFEVGVMLLTHLERLVRYDNLWIDCPGDEFAPGADDVFERAPFFDFHDGRVYFGVRYVGRAGENYGSASAFLPQ